MRFTGTGDVSVFCAVRFVLGFLIFHFSIRSFFHPRSYGRVLDALDTMRFSISTAMKMDSSTVATNSKTGRFF